MTVPIGLWVDKSIERSCNNQFACYHMINSRTGFSPEPWQSMAFDVIILRQDKVNFSLEDATDSWDYFCNLLDLYANDDGNPALTTQKWVEIRFEDFRRHNNDKDTSLQKLFETYLARFGIHLDPVIWQRLNQRA